MSRRSRWRPWLCARHPQHRATPGVPRGVPGICSVCLIEGLTPHLTPLWLSLPRQFVNKAEQSAFSIGDGHLSGKAKRKDTMRQAGCRMPHGWDDARGGGYH